LYIGTSQILSDKNTHFHLRASEKRMGFGSRYVVICRLFSRTLDMIYRICSWRFNASTDTPKLHSGGGGGGICLGLAMLREREGDCRREKKSSVA